MVEKKQRNEQAEKYKFLFFYMDNRFLKLCKIPNANITAINVLEILNFRKNWDAEF